MSSRVGVGRRTSIDNIVLREEEFFRFIKLTPEAAARLRLQLSGLEMESRRPGRGWVTTFDPYDKLNRPTTKNYSYTGGSPQGGVAAAGVSWVWDTVRIGKLSSVASDNHATQFTAYDAMGRVLASHQKVNGVDYPAFGYSYNKAGGLERETYPSGRVVTSCYDVAGREKGVSGLALGSTTPTSYTGTADIGYAAHGAIQTMTRGDGLTESWGYNNRLQPSAISVGSTAAPRSAFGLDLYYCPNKAASCATNNGNLLTASNAVLGKDQSYTYDPLNRLASAQEGTTPDWKETFGYDRFGNRWVDAANTSGLALSAFTATGSSNFDGANRLQIQPAGYDGAGSQKAIGGYVFTWDAEGRMATALVAGQTTTYKYDGDGRRVMKQQGSVSTVYLYDAGGSLAVEYGGDGTAMNCGICYLSVDGLGSTRAVTDGGGGVVGRHDYLPFGEELWAGTGGRTSASKYMVTGTADGLKPKFTGQLRDSEMISSAMPDGLDYFGARYMSAAQGRFTTVDPSMLSASLRNPQSWNRYSYTLNNPLRYIDPTGELWVATGDAANPYSWTDECEKGQTCHQAVAAVVNGSLSVYGSRDARDFQSYGANASGNVDLREVSAGSHDADFEIKPGAQGFLSLNNAAGFFNTAEAYSEATLTIRSCS